MSFIYYNLLVLFILEGGDKLEKKKCFALFFSRALFFLRGVSKAVGRFHTLLGKNAQGYFSLRKTWLRVLPCCKFVSMVLFSSLKRRRSVSQVCIEVSPLLLLLSFLCFRKKKKSPQRSLFAHNSKFFFFYIVGRHDATQRQSSFSWRVRQWFL